MRKNQQWILTKRPEGRLTEADLQLREGRVTECVKTLQRYWPRLLVEQFPAEPRMAANVDPPATEGADETSSPLDKIRQLVPRMRR